MKIGGKGGANTRTGLVFESKADFLLTLDAVPGYSIVKEEGNTAIHFNGKRVAWHLRKYALYRFLETRHQITGSNLLSKKLLPDDAVLVEKTKTLHIIEMKFQRTPGSVDEKLQTCHFKKKQYQKLVSSAGLKVEYSYILNDWFEKPEYKDVRDYIKEVGCSFYFHIIPLSGLGLPSSS